MQGESPLEEFNGVFEFRNNNTFEPQYGEIDWYSRWLARFAGQVATGQVAEIWLVMEEDKHEQQLHQENCEIRLNATDDFMDCIEILDERDNTYWRLYREQFSDFDAIINRLGPYVLSRQSRIPQEDIVDDYEELLLDDVDEADAVLDEWTEGDV